MENKYTHIERLKNPEVNGILIGEIFCYPKLDGANASVELIDEKIVCRSRKQILNAENTLKGFLNYCIENSSNFSQLYNFFREYPNIIIFGEWLIPHSIKNYKNDAWNKFYIFDFYDKLSESYLDFEECREIFSPLLSNFDFVPLIGNYSNLDSVEKLISLCEENNYLLESGKCEGIVIKNYSFVNKYGRTPFAKLINEKLTTTKEKVSNLNNLEVEIIDKFLSKEYLLKEINKVDEPHKKIGYLISTISEEFIRDYILEIISKYKYPNINFKKLKQEIAQRLVREIIG
jgi:hypothetical protein